MRHAVMAAAVAFHPQLKVVRRPMTVAARGVGQLVIAYLDRRRRQIDDLPKPVK